MEDRRHPNRSAAPRTLLAVALSLLLVVATATPALAREATPAATPAGSGVLPLTTATPTPTACADHYEMPKGAIDGTNVSCTYLAVPAFPGETGSPVISLFSMVLKSTSADPKNDPLVILHGGPGQSGGMLLPRFFPMTPGYDPMLASLLADQDVVLVDQRGTGASEPSLLCPGDVVPGLIRDGSAGASTPVATPATLTPAGTPSPIAVPSPDEISRLVVSCMGQYQSAGIDLTAFNTRNNAADIASLIHSLGLNRANLYGIGYGSLLAQAVMTWYPDLVWSAVLASVVPNDVNLMTGQLRAFSDALTRIFAACAEDSSCASLSSDLAGDLDAIYTSLDANPQTIPVTAGGQTIPLIFDGSTFLQLVYLLDFAGDAAAIPPLIASVARGDTTLLSKDGMLLTTPTGIASGTLISVWCQDLVPGTTEREVQALADSGALLPVIARGYVDQETLFYRSCAGVNLPAGAVADAPLGSNVPTLLVSGALDPITPPSYADDVAATLPNSQSVVISAAGHDPLTAAAACGTSILSSYLDAPSEEVDASCVAAFQLNFEATAPGTATPTS